MGIIARQGILNTIIIYSGIGLGFILTIYLFPHILNAEQYGLTRVLLSLAIVSTQFAQLGIKTTVLRYFPYFRNQEEDDKGLLFWTLMVPLFGIILLTLFFVIGKPLVIDFYQQRSSLFVDYYWLIIPLLLCTVYYAVLNSYVTALFNSFIGSLSNDVLLRFAIIVILLSYYFSVINFPDFITFFVLIHGISPLVLISYLVYRRELHLKPNFSFLSPNLVKEMGTYSLYAMIGGLTTVMVGNIDVIMLGSLSGLENTAIYFVAFSVGTVIAVPKRSIGKIATPVISAAFKNNNLQKIDYIYKQSALNQLIAGVLLYTGIWANLHNLFKILPEKYASGSIVILITGLGKLIDMASGVNGTIINISKYFRFNLYSNLFLIIITIVTNYILIPKMGIVGAALASTLSLFLYNLIKFLYVWKKLRLQPFKSSIFYVFLIGALTLGIGVSLKTFQNLYLDLIIRSSLMTLFFVPSIYFLNVSEDFNNLLINVVKRTRKLFH